jgi:PPOX class probable FMN-dependent enzyme
MARVIRSEEELREIVAPPTELVANKAIDHIDDASRRFLEASPFFLLATSAADGTCDVSPRGDPPGSVVVLDGRTLAFGDRKGNRRLDSLRNILANPQVGLLFLVPGVGDTLRVNGTARIVTEADYLPGMARGGVVPHLAIEVVVEELFLHCTKAFGRSALWDAATWPAKGAVPSAGQIVRSQHPRVTVPAAEIDAALEESAVVNRY